jgi:hypothetical protein
MSQLLVFAGWALPTLLIYSVAFNCSSFLVTTLAFRWDGKYLLSGGYGSQVIRWNWENISSVDLMEYGCNWIRDYVENSESQDFKASLCRNY